MDLIVVGFSYKKSPIQFLETVSFLPENLSSVYDRLLALDGVREAAILSTCNRSEIYAVVSDLHTGIQALRKFYLDYFALSFSDALSQQLYRFANDRMVTHLFSTISGLNSLVIGETQIAGQVKEAYRMAAQSGATKLILNRLFHKAFEVNKRVRAETRIGEGIVSVGHAAVELAEKIFYPLHNCEALIVGAGETATLTARHFREKGVSNIVVANRTFSRAQKLAENVGGRAIPLDSLSEYLMRADIVVSATASPEPFLTKESIQPILKKRIRKDIFLIDLAVPYDFDPKIRDLEGVYLYDIDDLRQIVDQNQRIRQGEADVARRLIQEEVQEFLRWLKGLQINPTIQQLRQRFEEIRQQELKNFKHQVSETDWAVVEEITRRMMNKMLHSPTTRLRKLFDNPDGIHKISLIKQLFELDDQ
ncbi:MAG: glutamyl-tRNA reductase [Calditrichaeota bacterium]|nr:glutamyl-tRNA reductase [Calditrichota bacterium]